MTTQYTMMLGLLLNKYGLFSMMNGASHPLNAGGVGMGGVGKGGGKTIKEKDLDKLPLAPEQSLEKEVPLQQPTDSTNKEDDDKQEMNCSIIKTEAYVLA